LSFQCYEIDGEILRLFPKAATTMRFLYNLTTLKDELSLGDDHLVFNLTFLPRNRALSLLPLGNVIVAYAVPVTKISIFHWNIS